MGGIRWIHKGTELRTFSDLRDVITANDGLNITSTLSLYEVHAEDNGVYLCQTFSTAYYVKGSDSRNATLTVRQAPEAISVPLSLFPVVGERFETECVFEGYPDPIVKWVDKNNAVVTTGGNWVVTNVSEGLEGVYRCVASNSQGITFSEWISITVYSAPRITSVFQEQIDTNVGLKLEINCNTTGEALLLFWRI